MQALDAGTSSKIAGFGFVCAFLVVMIHVPQPVPVDSSTPAWWLFRLTAGTFGRLGVPFYFAASGFFLARHLECGGGRTCRSVEHAQRRSGDRRLPDGPGAPCADRDQPL